MNDMEGEGEELCIYTTSETFGALSCARAVKGLEPGRNPPDLCEP